jgi:translation initiation factor 1 (eIF-1/SUI1)
MASQRQPPVANQNNRHRLTKTPCQSSKHGQVGKCKIQAVVRNKRNQMHIINGFDDQSDTYHDTWTNYLMKQEPSLTQDQADGGGSCYC